MSQKKSISIKSAEIEISDKLLRIETGEAMLKKIFRSNIEGSSLCLQDKYLDIEIIHIGINHFLLMLQTAFSEHKAIVIKPENIWILICQGFAQHIKLHKDKFKNTYFNIAGDDKILIEVRRDDFVMGGDNPWETIFPTFTEKINTHINPELHNRLVLDFSTSTPTVKTAFEITFMDTVSNYFDYSFITLCGIPEINIEGTKDDYQKMINSLQYLKEFDLDWWIDDIIPIIEEFIAVFDGNTNHDFWKSIFKQKSKSGGPFITGWITHFFPYIKRILIEENGEIDYNNYEIQPSEVLDTIGSEIISDTFKEVRVLLKNPVFDNKSIDNLKLSNFAGGVSIVPFKWNYFGKVYDMSFVSGLIGITSDNNVLKTDINWVVKHKS